MNKKKNLILTIAVVSACAIIGGIISYFSFYKKSNSDKANKQ